MRSRDERARGHGEGSIRQLPDGRWRGELMVGYRPDDRRDARVAYGKTRKQCQGRLDELKQRRGRGLLADAGKERETLAARPDRWLASINGAVRPSIAFRRNLRGVRDGEPIVDDLKTDASRRVVSITAESVASLRADRDRQNFKRQRLADAYRDSGLVFATALGTALGERPPTSSRRRVSYLVGTVGPAGFEPATLEL